MVLRRLLVVNGGRKVDQVRQWWDPLCTLRRHQRIRPLPCPTDHLIQMGQRSDQSRKLARRICAIDQLTTDKVMDLHRRIPRFQEVGMTRKLSPICPSHPLMGAHRHR